MQGDGIPCCCRRADSTESSSIGSGLSNIHLAEEFPARPVLRTLLQGPMQQYAYDGAFKKVTSVEGFSNAIAFKQARDIQDDACGPPSSMCTSGSCEDHVAMSSVSDHQEPVTSILSEDASKNVQCGEEGEDDSCAERKTAGPEPVSGPTPDFHNSQPQTLAVNPSSVATGRSFARAALRSFGSSEGRPQQSRRLTRARECHVDKDVLRAVPAWRAMQRCGSLLQCNKGSTDTYNLSERVDTIDHFWSHSWASNRVYKICTLICLYWGKIAACGSVVATVVVAILVQFTVIPGRACDDIGCSSHDDCSSSHYCDVMERCMPAFVCCTDSESSITGECPPSCLDEEYLPAWWNVLTANVGFIVFVTLMLVWRPRARVFLDKVCIHQTDLDKKRRGIDGLGGFLRCSKKMVVLWDENYFTRLWCVFELAAYLHLMGEKASIVVVPIVQGFATLFGIFLAFLVYFFNCFQYYGETRSFIQVVLPFAYVITGTIAAHVCRHFARHRYLIRAQLQRFSCDDAQCWCCEVGHVNPETNEHVDCDRTLVYTVIDNWFEGGRAELESIVRTNIVAQVEQNFNGMLGYSDVLRIAIPALWHGFYLLGTDCASGATLRRSLLRIFANFLAWSPLSIAFLVWLSALVRHRLERCDALVSMMVGSVWTALSYVLRLENMQCHWPEEYVIISSSVVSFALAQLMIRGVFLEQTEGVAVNCANGLRRLVDIRKGSKDSSSRPSSMC